MGLPSMEGTAGSRFFPRRLAAFDLAGTKRLPVMAPRAVRKERRVQSKVLRFILWFPLLGHFINLCVIGKKRTSVGINPSPLGRKAAATQAKGWSSDPLRKYIRTSNSSAAKAVSQKQGFMSDLKVRPPVLSHRF